MPGVFRAYVDVAINGLKPNYDCNFLYFKRLEIYFKFKLQ